METPNFNQPNDQIDQYPESQIDTQQTPSAETYMVGFVLVNIVGIQYYTGRISGREMVGLIREPLNVYDENAIKVVNTRNIQVGHVERGVAKVLAPLMDTHLIIVEGIVPNSVAKNVRFKIACQVHIFARIDAIGVVKDAVLSGGLDLVCDGNASFALSDSVVVKEKRSSKDVMSVDEIFRLVGDNVGGWGGFKEGLEPPKDVIVSELYDHQKEGLAWLVWRESCNDLPPFWEERDGSFVNVLTNYQTNVRPDPIRGGIFADDMGLGKTLTLLSLIAYDRECGQARGETRGVEVVEEKKGKRGRKGKTASTSCGSSRKKRNVDGGDVGGGLSNNSEIINAKTTLVVCPPSVFSTWVNQLCEHTRRGSLNMYMYYGVERTQSVKELQKYDIIITTYQTLSIEEGESGSPIKKMQWRRIILDEGHLIKNPSAHQSRAVTALNGDCRWVVTGTPIQNTSYDLFSLMAFLKFDPFSNKGYWNRLIQRPLAQGDVKGLERLQVLMATVSLRRTKDQNLVALPSKTIQICHVDLLPEERELYDRMEEEAKNVVKNYINNESVTRNYSTVLGIILRLRQICADVALCPHDIKSLLPAENIGDVANNPELLEKLVCMLQDGEDFDCPICISPPTDLVITCCAHLFCRSCIIKTLKRTKASCPMCRHPLSEADLFSAPPPESSSSSSSDSTATTPSSSSKPSSKTSVLLKLLSESQNKGEKTVKSVVFSQFRKMLILLEEPLKAAGFKTVRLDGTMNAKKRGQVIEEFGNPNPGSPTVLLASLKASGAGINLTAASVVYLFEPWWNPGAEDQAMDRVHRIGQKSNVNIVRIIARSTIEERVLELQEKKRELARGAFGRKGSKNNKEVNVDDLRKLVSL